MFKNHQRKLIKSVMFFGLVFLLILPSITPLTRKGFFKLHDFTHVARLVELDLALKDGHFPARWSKDLGWGYGMPLFQFYGPLPYYISEIFYLLGFSFVDSIKLCFGLTFFISFLGMFILAKKFWGKWGGFLAALAFVYSPYRAVDFYVRGALGELFAIGLIPWVLWGITELVDRKNKKTVGLKALLLALFLLSHTVLTFIGLPLFLFFAAFYALVNKISQKVVVRLFKSFALGFGLASFFLIPAFFEKKFSQVDKLISGYSHYAHHFLYLRQFLGGRWGYGGSVDGIEDGISFHLGKVHLGLAVATLALSLLSLFLKRKLENKTLTIIFFFTLILVLVFLSTYHAKSIWDSIPMMAFIQFPWRLNSFIIVFLAFLTGGAIYYLKKFCKPLTFILLLGAVFFLLKTNIKYFKPEEYVDLKGQYYTDQELIKNSMSEIIPDYLPIWVKNIPREAAENEYEIISGEPKVKVIKSKTHQLFLEISSDKPTEVQLNRFYFPGWKLFINGKETSFEYENNNGLIKTTLPSGKYVLKLIFERTLIRQFSEALSIISFCLFVFILFDKKFLAKKMSKKKKSVQK